jgi:hypothetical protein
MIEWKPLTAFEFFYLIITFCGFVGVVVSLFFLTRQTRLVTRQVELLTRQTELLTNQTELLTQSAQCDTYASITTNLTMTKQIFIEYPFLRPYFYDGLDISEDNDKYHRAEGVAEHLLDFFDGVLQLNEKGQLWPQHLWANYIKDSFRNSPILRDYLEKTKDWYSSKLLSHMEKH